MDENNKNQQTDLQLPRHARLPTNHCNLPAGILGSLTFQRHPVALKLDGVETLHAELFNHLERIEQAEERALNFQQYMKSAFLLDHLDEAGFDPASHGRRRNKADYLRMLRGWLFDPDGKEGAVLKGWVESRFGLRPLNHRGPLRDTATEGYLGYQIDRARGLYNANALESQLDLLFSYCQYEVRRRFNAQSHVVLYRGINRIDEHEILQHRDRHEYVLVLNNLNSFSGNRDRADEFGDYIMEVEIPLSKCLYIPNLLPGSLKGEDEYLVIGGVYQVRLSLI